MRIQRSNQPKKLYRKVNTTTWGQVQNHPGGEYRWLRHKKNIADDNLPMREGMHGRLERGRDYTPLYKFLLSKVGQRWDDVHKEAVSRLDNAAPIFLWSDCIVKSGAAMSVAMSRLITADCVSMTMDYCKRSTRNLPQKISP